MMSDTVDVRALPLVAEIIDQYTVVLNRGSEDGIKLGARFLIFGIGDEVTDPETGESLGKLELVKGTGSVRHVQRKICTVKSETTRKRTPTIKTIRRNPSSPGLNLFGRADEEVIEERQGDPIEVPFENVQRGDHARPI